MAMILFRKLSPKDDIMLLNCVEVHSSADAEPLVSDLGVVSTLFTTLTFQLFWGAFFKPIINCIAQRAKRIATNTLNISLTTT